MMDIRDYCELLKTACKVQNNNELVIVLYADLSGVIKDHYSEKKYGSFDTLDELELTLITLGTPPHPETVTLHNVPFKWVEKMASVTVTRSDDEGIVSEICAKVVEPWAHLKGKQCQTLKQ